MGKGNGRPMGLRLLSVTVSALALMYMQPVSANEVNGKANGAALAPTQAQEKYEFDIPSQPLPQAIAEFSAITGLQILYTTSETFKFKVPALKGRMSAADALAKLLEGTGLIWRSTSSSSVTVERAPAPETGYMLSPVSIYGSKSNGQLNDTTASVGIVNSDDIEQHKIRNFRDAFRTLGNVLDGDWPDSGFHIRGINSEGLTAGGKPLASLYLDGVPQTVNGARRGARGLWDVEQVEVYRGPQSTLSGRTALAGSVYIKSKDPTFEKEAAVRATVGTLRTRETAFMYNTPIIDDQVSVRLSAEYHIAENDINYPKYESYDRYEEFIEDEYYQIRGKILLTPKNLPDTTALLTYSRAHDSPQTDDIGGPDLGFDYDENRGDFNTAVFSESRKTDTDNLSLDIQHDLTSDLLFTSLTTYSRSRMHRPSVNEGTDGETNINIGIATQYVASQELRLNYERGDWKAVGGFYGAIEDDENWTHRPDYFGNVDNAESHQRLYNGAFFGEATFEFLPSWKIVAGGRADYSKQHQRNYSERNGAIRGMSKTSYDEFVFLPKFGLIKELASGHTISATAQKAFRNGGSGVQTSSGKLYSFDPEFAWNYELSYKGSFMNNRLQTTANAFFMDWTDQQVELDETPGNSQSRYVSNAGESEVYGFELENKFAVSKELSSFLSVGYVNTEFKEFNHPTYGDLSGYPFPTAPQWSIAFGGTYDRPDGFFIGADAKYVSSFLARFGNAPQEYLSSYWVANLQAGYKRDNWELAVFSENVLDERYFLYNDRKTTGDVAATLGPRRVIGVSLTAEF